MFRRIDRAEAAATSLWPDRIDGKQPWQKRTRDPAEVREEYETRYDKMRALWAGHKREFAGQPPALWPLSFIHRLNAQNWSQMQSLPKVYGNVDLDRYLVSFADELYDGNVAVMEAFFRQLVVQSLQRVIDRGAVRRVIELGCGAGFNLINIALHCAVPCIGCDLSPSAVALVNEIGRDSGLSISAREHNFIEGGIGQFAESDDWALLTVHAIEQTPGIDEAWFERLLAGKNAPAAGVHIEPLHDGSGQFADDCRRYAEINHYNRDFYALVRKLERAGLLDVLHFSPRVLGSQAYNPSSVLVWQPRQRTAQGVRAW